MIVDGPDTGRLFEVAGVTVLGRDPSVGIVLADDEVSRRHASVMAESEGLMIEDLGSRNGTYVNGERIEGSRQLVERDKFRVGRTVLQLCSPTTRLGAASSTHIGVVPPSSADASEPAV